MPELPEVETNARNLATWAVGRRIVGADPPVGARQRNGIGRRVFRTIVEGRRVERVGRRGKWMLVCLEGGAALGLHLGMTGKLGRVEGRARAPRFTRAVLELDDGARVCFIDPRRFGRVVASARLEDLVARREIASIGPDALAEAKTAHLAAGLSRTARSVKEVLLDQRVIAGVGNLYATEALWRARIHPATPARAIAADPAAVRRLLAAVRASLRHGLALLEGSLLPRYLEDGAANEFRVYDRAGEPCPRCRTTLRAMTIGGRTSAFCPACQRGSRR